MAPTLRDFVTRIASRAPVSPTRIYDNGPLAANAVLLARDDAATTAVKVNGVTHVESINNNAMFALFGILGAALCVGIIWFFFWAKNGGFYFKENDWDDYKSTVLRRKGPNGTILSGATKTTRLGGGSVYKDVYDGGETVITDVTGTTESTAMSGITAGVSDIGARQKRRAKEEKRKRERERRRAEKEQQGLTEEYNEKDTEVSEKKKKKKDKPKKERTSRHVNEEGVLIDAEAEAEAQAYLRNYRHERAARVGGLNTTSEGSQWDGSNPSHSAIGSESTVTAELLPNRQETPTNTPKKSSKSKAAAAGIRKVYSTADRNETRENARLRSEARRLERGERSSRRALTYGEVQERSSGARRDFSFRYGEDVSTPLRQIEEGSSRVDYDDGDIATQAYTDSGAPESDLGTKSYRCYIPGLSSTVDEAATEQQESAYTEEKRKQRKERRSRQ